MLNAGDKEEMELVIVSEITLHLRRIHAAKRLRNVNRGNAQRGKNIAGHLAQREDRAKRQSNHRDNNCQRSAQCRLSEVHRQITVDFSVSKTTIASKTIAQGCYFFVSLSAALSDFAKSAATPRPQ